MALILRTGGSKSAGIINEIFISQLSSLMNLYKQAFIKVDSLEQQIVTLIRELNAHTLSIPDIGPLSATVIYLDLILHPKCFLSLDRT